MFIMINVTRIKLTMISVMLSPIPQYNGQITTRDNMLKLINGVSPSNSLGSSLPVLISEDNEPVHVGVAKELTHDSALKPRGSGLYNQSLDAQGYQGLVVASLKPRHLFGGWSGFETRWLPGNC